MELKDLVLGKWYKDVVTGDYGVLTKYTEHISGCTRALLATPMIGVNTEIIEISQI